MKNTTDNKDLLGCFRLLGLLLVFASLLTCLFINSPIVRLPSTIELMNVYPCKEQNTEWIETDRFRQSEVISICADLDSKNPPVELSFYIYEMTANDNLFFIHADSETFQNGLIVFSLTEVLSPGRYSFKIRWRSDQVGEGEFIVLSS